MAGLRIALGAAVYAGTVVVVALAGPAAAATPAGRWRIGLGPPHPYHEASQRLPREAPGVVADAQEAAEAAMADGLRTLLAGLAGRPVGLAVLAVAGPQPEEVAQVVLSQALMDAADEALYRDAVLAGALQAGLDATVLAAEDVPVGTPADAWARAERRAAAAALAVLAQSGGPR